MDYTTAQVQANNDIAEHHLYKLISTHLKANPTTAETPMRLQIQGMPMPKDNKITPPAIPRGSKIGTILPLHSPALSGGGVSENFLKDVCKPLCIPRHKMRD